MRAFYIEEAGRYSYKSIPEPEITAGEVLIRINRVGLCGTDLKIYEGKNPLVSYPRMIGHEISGTIVDLGAQVADSLQKGMRVAVYPGTHCGKCNACRQGRYNTCRDNEIYGVQRDGALVEYLSVPADKVFPSDSLSLQELALVEPLAVGMHAVSRSNVASGETLAVFGTGMIGLSVIAGAADQGAHVIAIDIDDEKLQIAKQAGAHYTVNSRVENLHSALRDLTSGEGPQIMVEAVGLPHTFRAAVEEVAFAGRVIYIGWVNGEVNYDTSYFVKKELDIRGSRTSLPEDFRTGMDLLEQRKFPAKKVVGQVVPFSETGKILEEWHSNPAAVYKIQIELM